MQDTKNFILEGINGKIEKIEGNYSLVIKDIPRITEEKVVPLIEKYFKSLSFEKVKISQSLLDSLDNHKVDLMFKYLINEYYEFKLLKLD